METIDNAIVEPCKICKTSQHIKVVKYGSITFFNQCDKCGLIGPTAYSQEDAGDCWNKAMKEIK